MFFKNRLEHVRLEPEEVYLSFLLGLSYMHIPD